MEVTTRSNCVRSVKTDHVKLYDGRFLSDKILSVDCLHLKFCKVQDLNRGRFNHQGMKFRLQIFIFFKLLLKCTEGTASFL